MAIQSRDSICFSSALRRIIQGFWATSLEEMKNCSSYLIVSTNLAQVFNYIHYFDLYIDNAVARVLLNKQDGSTYAMAIKEIFLKTTTEHPAFKMGTALEEIVVDFSDAESNGFRNAIGEDLAAKLLRGCNVCTKSWLQTREDKIHPSSSVYIYYYL